MAENASKRQLWGVKCCIKSCGITKRKDPKSRFFRFPHSESPLFQVWLEKCKIRKPPTAKTFYVCNRHFLLEQQKRRRLDRKTVPSLNLPEDYDDVSDSGPEVKKFLNEPNKSNEQDTLIIKTYSNSNKTKGQIYSMLNKDRPVDLNKVITTLHTISVKTNAKRILLVKSAPLSKLPVLKKSDQESEIKLEALEVTSSEEKFEHENQNIPQEMTNEIINNENDQSGGVNDIANNANNNGSIKNYKEALEYLKPLEEFTLLNEDLRGVGLINQLEIYFKDKFKAMEEEFQLNK